MLRVARIFRLLAILRLYRIVQAYRGYDYQLAVLAFLIVALVMVAAGIFQALEQSYYADQGLDPLQFHVAVYFVFVTVATVGTWLPLLLLLRLAAHLAIASQGTATSLRELPPVRLSHQDRPHR